ncbi:MAG: murein biosynthesis integral membrane protein MurJ [Thermaerobacter sp.]|nr:murein biosynthesis integral membrane protein MurJ [Thermaerobacter sp.]
MASPGALSNRMHRAVGTRAAALIILAGTALSKVLGFSREMAMAAIFGTTLATDTWLMASVLPNLFFSTLNSTLSNVVIPILSGRTPADPRDRRNLARYLNELFTAVTLASLALVLVGEVLAGPITHVIAPSYHGQKFGLTVAMTRWMLPTVLLWAVSGLITGVLQSRRVYAPTTAAPLIMNVVRIGTIVSLGLWLGITGVAIGFTLAVFGQTVYLWSTLGRQHIRLVFRWHLRHPWMRETLRLSWPFFYANSVGTIGLIVDRVLASGLATGNVAALNYAFVVSQLPVTLLLNPLVTPLFTRLAETHNGRDRRAYFRLVRLGLVYSTALLVPTALALAAFRVPILSLVYQHGVFGQSSTALTARDLSYWAVGLPAFGWTFFLSKILFANRATRIVLWNSTITIAVNIALDLVLIRPMGAAGLALGTGLAAWVRTALMAAQLVYISRRATNRVLAREG